MASSTHPSAPCAACKFLRRKCIQGCVFSPYFPPEDPIKFTNVHKIFGASNVSKLLSEFAPHQREDVVNSLAYEAEARLKDPIYGCVDKYYVGDAGYQNTRGYLAIYGGDKRYYWG
ncbi:hypothetical protein SSX86_010672 [Deinandra increscens subsp. villosa]|uniref:LOB domain-containing protein n=1 Tax=Deinandra increscens subsp. villosa TaxID=3103831 RepID=A0AAP0H3E6_9ASTR